MRRPSPSAVRWMVISHSSDRAPVAIISASPIHEPLAMSAWGSRALQYVTRVSHHGHSG